MRVLYIAQFFAPPTSASGTRHWWVVQHLLKAGHEVTVVTGPNYLSSEKTKTFGYSEISGVKTWVVGVRYTQNMGAFARMWSYFKFMLGASAVALLVKRPDVIVASSVPLTVGLPALLARLLRGTPFLFEVSDLWPDVPIALGFLKNRLLNKLLWWFEKSVYRKAAAVVAFAPGVRDAIVEKGIEASKVVVVPNMSATDMFGPHVKGDRFRECHGLVDKFICAHTGTMGFVNGVGTILDTAKLLRDSHPEVVFMLVGRGSEQPELEKRALAEGLHNVRFIDAIPKKEMAECLAAVDLGLMTVRNFKILEHNSANKFFDYLASGKPVLLNYGGWQAEWLRRYDAGVSVKSGDAEAMATEIVSLVEKPERMTVMGRNARRLAEEQFAKDRHLARLEKVVRAAVHGFSAEMVEPWPFSSESDK